MTTIPGEKNFTIYQGATFNPLITWKDQDGNLVNLTGFTARLHVRRKITDTSPFITLTTENGGITLGGAAGTIQLLISATDTAALKESEGVYDLELVDGSEVHRLLMGTVTISREVTR